MNSLLFLTNNLQQPTLRHNHLIPAEPLGIGLMCGRMYQYGSDSLVANPPHKPQGNSVVYGTLYHITNFEHWIRAIDAYHYCSLSLLGRAHQLDLQHREERDIMLINPTDTEALLSLNYTELSTVKAYVYVANENHPKVKQLTNYNLHRYRINSGLRVALITQWEELWQ